MPILTLISNLQLFILILNLFSKDQITIVLKKRKNLITLHFFYILQIEFKSQKLEGNIEIKENSQHIEKKKNIWLRLILRNLTCILDYNPHFT